MKRNWFLAFLSVLLVLALPLTSCDLGTGPEKKQEQEQKQEEKKPGEQEEKKTQDPSADDLLSSDELLSSASDSLKDGDLDKALDYYDKAYAKDTANMAAAVYSSLGQLAKISVDPGVVSLMKDRLGIKDYPGTLGALFSDDWMKEYQGDQIYGYPPRYDTSSLPELSVPSWFGDGSQELGKASTWPILFFANLLDKNTSGLNDLLDGILGSVFGSSFETISARIDGLPKNKPAQVDAYIIEQFGLDGVLEGDGLSIGQAELQALTASLRIVKASLQWIASYNWNTNLNFLKYNWLNVERNFQQIVSSINPSDLPLRNNFLKARSGADTRLADSKANYHQALTGLIDVYNQINSRTDIPQAARDAVNSYAWIKDGLTKLDTAITGGKTFYIPGSTPGGTTWTNSATGAVFAIDFGKFFTSGQLSLNTLIETEGSGTTIAPKFYGFKNGTSTAITNSSNLNSYEEFGFQFTYNSLKAVIPTGLDDYLPTAGKPVSLFPAPEGKILYNRYH